MKPLFASLPPALVVWGARAFLLGWYGVITFLSSQPYLPGPQAYWPRFWLFKLAHLIVYAILAFAVYLVFQTTWPQLRSKQTKWFVILSVLVLAAVDELHQFFVPGRGPHIRDVMIDVFAAWLVMQYVVPSIAAIRLIQPRRPSTKR